MNRWLSMLLLLICSDPAQGAPKRPLTACDSLEITCEQMADTLGYSGRKLQISVLPLRSDSIPCKDVVEVIAQPTVEPEYFLILQPSGVLGVEPTILASIRLVLQTACLSVQTLKFAKKPRVIRFVAMYPLSPKERLLLYEAIWNPEVTEIMNPGADPCLAWTEIGTGLVVSKETEPFQYQPVWPADVFNRSRKK